MRHGLLVLSLLAIGCVSSGERRAERPQCPVESCGPVAVSAARLRSFTTTDPPVLLLTPFGDGKFWVVRKQFQWINKLGCVTVPTGFVTDLTSVPRFLWTVLPTWEQYGGPAIVHDFLYWNQPVDRYDADQWILQLMDQMQVKPTKRHTIYTALRLFGNVAWSHNKQAQAHGKNACLDPLKLDDLAATSTWKQYQQYAIQCSGGVQPLCP
jgi:hypothetical protein